MIVVRVELHPGGDASRAREIGRAEIWAVEELRGFRRYAAALDGVSLGDVLHNPRKGVWDLLGRVLGKYGIAQGKSAGTGPQALDRGSDGLPHPLTSTR